MGASARETERQIKETPDHMDDKVMRLESRASFNARRYGLLAAVAAGVALAAGAGFLLYRRLHRPTLRDRLENLSMHDLCSLASGLSGQLKDRLPSVTVRINEKTEQEPGIVWDILREVAPELVGSAGPALLDRVVSGRHDRYASRKAE